MEPRRHHVQMKYMLAQMALQSPERFFATFGPSGDATYLADLWAAVGQDLPADQQVPNNGVAAWHRPAGEEPEVIVLTLPRPIARNEAYFIAVVRLSNECRVFCLEKAAMPSTDGEFTVLSEVALDGRSNWGSGGDPEVKKFSALVCRVAADPSARPMAFVPIQLG